MKLNKTYIQVEINQFHFTTFAYNGNNSILTTSLSSFVIMFHFLIITIYHLFFSSSKNIVCAYFTKVSAYVEELYYCNVRHYFICCHSTYIFITMFQTQSSISVSYFLKQVHHHDICPRSMI